MNEIWKTIKGFPDYEVSNLGNVRRAVTKNYLAGRALKPDVSPLGYCRATLCKNGKASKHLIHRLVAHAFHGEPEFASMHASHLNGVRSDNRADNLAWKTPSANNGDKVQHGTAQRGEKAPRSVLTARDVLSIRALQAEKAFGVKRWGSTLIARELNLPPRAVKHVLQGSSWKHMEATQ